MNVEIVAEVAQFPEKEYINGIVVAVRDSNSGIPYSSPAHYQLSYAAP
jgi:hypothetical protein